MARRRGRGGRRGNATSSHGERESAARTVKERGLVSRFVFDFFGGLWMFLMSFRLPEFFKNGPREVKNEPSLLPRAETSLAPSALAKPSGTNVAAERASEEQEEGSAEEIRSVGIFQNKDLCQEPYLAGNRYAAFLHGECSSDGEMVGGNRRREEAEVHLFERLTEDKEIKPEQSRSGNGYRKRMFEYLRRKYEDLKRVFEDPKRKYEDLKRVFEDLKRKYEDLKRKYDDLQRKCEAQEKNTKIFEEEVMLRQALAVFRKTQKAEFLDNGISEEVLKLPAAKSEKIVSIFSKNVSATRIVCLMFYQRDNLDMEFSFSDPVWRSDRRFPNLDDKSASEWWLQNFDRDTVERRLEIFRQALRNWDPEFEYFWNILQIAASCNSDLHPELSRIKLCGMDELKRHKGVDFQPLVSYMLSDGNKMEKFGDWLQED